jgi:PAS domain S-box-containing protein
LSGEGEILAARGARGCPDIVTKDEYRPPTNETSLGAMAPSFEGGKAESPRARPAEAGFAAVAAIAARLLGVSCARVLMHDALQTEGEFERHMAMRALERGGVLLVADVAKEPGLPPAPGGIRFYAGAPLVARDGRRFGVLAVMDRAPRAALGDEDLRHLERLARLLVDEIELTAELGSRRLAEARLKLANDITDAALAAPDFKAAITACLEGAAEHVGAEVAFARALSPRTGKLEIEADYLSPAAAEFAALHRRLRATGIAPQESVIAGMIDAPHPLVIPDVGKIDTRGIPLLDAARAHGLNCLATIPCENRGSVLWLTFLFRRAPADLAGVTDTLTSLTGRVRDLLARKQSEEQIALLQSVVLHTGDGVVISEAGEPGGLLRILYVNPAFTRMTGLTAEAVRDRPAAELAAPQSEEFTLRRLAAIVKRPRSLNVGMHLRRQDGTLFWAEIDVTPVADAQGAIRRWIAVIRDRTDRKAAEDALRREKDFSEFLIRRTTEGILVFDRDFRITLWNPGLEAITGIAAADAAGQNAFALLPFLQGTAGERAMRGTLSGAESSFFDQRYAIPATGRRGFYEAHFSPLKSSASGIMGGIGFLRETTERRRMEEELRQSQKMEAVGQLTGGIAHDFNNMLTVIAGNLELLEGRLKGDARLMRLVTSAGLAASRAEKLTQQLLTFSRRQQLRPQAVDLNQIVIGMDEMLHRTVGETIEIRTLLAADLKPALADRNQIETALLNLVLNARDAMPSGGGITIETANVDAGRSHAELPPGAYAMLSIADTGLGMSEHVLAHVFEPFFTTKEIGKGTGLGLAQVYGFITQSAGHVRIASKEGQGTVVRLYLPRAEAALGGGGQAQAREDLFRGSETVLVVEDDDGVRDFAASVLRERGYRVLEASTGDAALPILDAHPEIDLLFTDVVMPGRLNGADLARAARQLRPTLAVLFTSGYTTRFLEKEWPAEEAELLRKPYRSIDLAERVRVILDRAQKVDGAPVR